MEAASESTSTPSLRAAPQPTRARPRRRSTALSNTNPATDPRKRELQYQCHRRYVIEGLSYTAIAAEFGIDREIVSMYVRIESEARAVEREAARAVETDRSISIYNDLIRVYRAKIDQPGARGDEGRTVLQARQRIDALLALEATPKAATSDPTRTPLVGVSTDAVAALLLLVAKQPPR